MPLANLASNPFSIPSRADLTDARLWGPWGSLATPGQRGGQGGIPPSTHAKQLPPIVARVAVETKPVAVSFEPPRWPGVVVAAPSQRTPKFYGLLLDNPGAQLLAGTNRTS